MIKDNSMDMNMDMAVDYEIRMQVTEKVGITVLLAEHFPVGEDGRGKPFSNYEKKIQESMKEDK